MIQVALLAWFCSDSIPVDDKNLKWLLITDSLLRSLSFSLKIWADFWNKRQIAVFARG